MTQQTTNETTEREQALMSALTDAKIYEWAEGYQFTYKGNPHKMTFARNRFIEAVRVIIGKAGRAALPPTSGEAVDRRRCKPCASTRGGDTCWKCGTPTFEPHPSCGDDPALPPIDRIRALAKEVGYAIGVHGSQQRDFDVIAAPWTDAAIGNHALLEHIAKGLATDNGPAHIISTERKPLGRYAATIQMDGWYKQLDISVCPNEQYAMPPAAPAAPVADTGVVAVPRATLEAIYDAMNHMGDQLNAMDVVEAEDEKVFPAFDAIRCLLAAPASPAPTADSAADVDPLEQARRDGWSEGMQEAQSLLESEIADAARLDFMAQNEAWIAWSKDGEGCRVFHRDEDGDVLPMLGWGARHWRHSARDAIDAAMSTNTGEGEG